MSKFEETFTRLADRELARKRAADTVVVIGAKIPKRDCQICGRLFLAVAQMQIDCSLCRPVK